ncbi:MAG: tetratricopeptide repeat protein [Bacteriovoracia bacterium]
MREKSGRRKLIYLQIIKNSLASSINIFSYTFLKRYPALRIERKAKIGFGIYRSGSCHLRSIVTHRGPFLGRLLGGLSLALVAVFLPTGTAMAVTESVRSSAIIVKAEACLNRGDFVSAEGLFRSARERKELLREATIGLAAALAGQGKVNQGIEILRENIANFPSDVQSHLKLSDLFLDSGQAEAAKNELEKVKFLRPGHPELREREGLIRAAMGKKSEAISILESLREKESLSETSFTKLAKLQLDQGNKADALRVLEDRESRYAPSKEAYLLTAATLKAQKKFPKAEIYYRRAVQLESDDPALWFSYGEFLLEAGRVEEGRETLEKGLRLDPSPAHLTNVASIFERTGLQQAAVDTYARVLQLSPGNDKAMFGIVRIEEKRGYIDRVGSHLQNWNEEFPKKVWVALSYSRLLLAVGQKTKAQEIAKNALAVSPDNSELGEFLARLKGEQPMNLPRVEIDSPKPESIRREPAKETRNTYIVGPGEVLGVISSKVYGTSKLWRKIFDANRRLLSSPDSVEPGMKLKIPEVRGRNILLPDESSIPRARKHFVKKGESLRSIAKKVYGSSGHWRVIYKANRQRLKKANNLHAGIKLLIPQLSKESEGKEAAGPQVSAFTDHVRIFQAAPERGKRQESILVSPDSVKLPEVPTYPEQQPVSNQEREARDEVFETSAYGGAQLSSYSLSGENGYFAKLPLTVGSLLGARVAVRPRNWPRIGLSAERVATDFPIVPGVTTAAISLSELNISLDGEFTSGQFSFRPGYRIHKRKLGAPYRLVPGSEQHGPFVRVIYIPLQSAEWNASVFADLFFPISYSENDVSSGSSKLRYAVVVGGSLFCRLSKSFELGTSPKFSYFYTSFSGTGSRSVSNVKESWISVSVPLEVRYAF